MTRAYRWRLATEFGLLFVVVVGAYLVLDVPGGPIPPLVVAGILAALALRRDPGFDRRRLWNAAALRPALLSVLLLWAAVSVAATAGVALAAPDRLFDMPRRETALWLAVVLLYPLLSVYPQELLYRAYLLHRFAPLLGTGRGAAAVSAAVFSFAHLLFGNVLAVAATLVGGWLFARRYQRTRSLLVTSVEHALYGITIFTIGLGRFFYHGTEVVCPWTSVTRRCC
ncbi:CPBP family glutamic-type intramembrane protease [Actinoplanes sp. NPDC004185]